MISPPAGHGSHVHLPPVQPGRKFFRSRPPWSCPVIADSLVEHVLGQVGLRPLAVQPRLVVNPDCFCARLLRSSSIPCHHLALA